MRLQGNKTLVTGDASGIGAAIASALLARNNPVIICGRYAAKLAAARMQEPRLQTYRCDLACEADRASLCRTLAQDHPDLNILVNNAGIQYELNFFDGEDHAARIEEEVAINFLAARQLIDHLLPGQVSQPAAAIVNITLALALQPKQSAPVYCATKAAMRSFSKALRYQLEATTVRVLEVVPPLVDTAMTRARSGAKWSPDRLASVVMRGLKQDRPGLFVGKARLLYLSDRLALPTVATHRSRRLILKPLRRLAFSSLIHLP